jgi:hypothetical protein
MKHKTTQRPSNFLDPAEQRTNLLKQKRFQKQNNIF